MTQKDKQLLLKDLCARLPYKLRYNFGGNEGCDYTMDKASLVAVDDAFPIEEVKPYLRPMSSMTEEEVKEIRKINWQFWKPKNDSDECFVGDADDGYCSVSQMARIINYLNAHHFDYLGLIPMGLALEAPEGMYKTE